METLIAHQGGWDEVLILLAPVAIFALLRLAERRRRPTTPTAGRRPESEEPESPDGG